MANGIVIGNGQYRMGEVFANIANQQQQMAIQQQNQQDQLAMERMRMAQAQRNADAEQQFRYASLEQQAQEAERGRRFTAERDQFGADKQMTLEQMRIGAGREERQDAREFTKEQNALDRQQRDELARQNQEMEVRRMELTKAIEQGRLDQQAYQFAVNEIQQIDQRKKDNEFRLKDFDERIRQFNVATEGKDLDRKIKEEDLLGKQTYREGQQELLRLSKDPVVQYKKLAMEANTNAARQVSDRVKSLSTQLEKETDPKRRKSLQGQLDLLNADYDGAVKRTSEFYMRGIPQPEGIKVNAPASPSGFGLPPAAIKAEGLEGEAVGRASTLPQTVLSLAGVRDPLNFTGADLIRAGTETGMGIRGLNSLAATPARLGVQMGEYLNRGLGGKDMKPEQRRKVDNWASNPFSPDAVLGLFR